ncbi:MAG: hypothetical protein QM783_03720 [Phycisphaerales bacterium]
MAEDPLENLGLTVRRVDGNPVALLVLAHLDDQTRPFVDDVDELAIQRVDPGTQVGEGERLRSGSGFAGVGPSGHQRTIG